MEIKDVEQILKPAIDSKDRLIRFSGDGNKWSIVIKPSSPVRTKTENTRSQDGVILNVDLNEWLQNNRRKKT